MKRVLILTAGFGEGHNSAARGVLAALEQLGRDTVQAEVRDLFEETYGMVHDLVSRAYIGTINHAPVVWQKIYDMVDSTEMVERNLAVLMQMRRRLERLVEEIRPDAVISTYPLYGYLFDKTYGERCPFIRFMIVTDSISVNSVWYKSASEWFIVANHQTAGVLLDAGIEEAKVKVFGFPVDPRYAGLAGSVTRAKYEDSRWKVLYMINSGKKQAPNVVRALLHRNDIKLTITVGRDKDLFGAINKAVRGCPHSAEIIGWTTEMPQLMASNHLLIGKAGGATVQEAIAARCPMIVSQIVPGQEEGNARLIVESGSGFVAASADQIPHAVERALADDGALLRCWMDNVARLSRPAASLDIAKFVLAETHN